MINVVFDLVDSAGKQLYTRLHISPYETGFNYSGSIVSADSIVVHEQGKQAVVELVPNSYQVRCWGKNADTSFNIILSSSLDNTTQSASNWIYNFVPNCYNNGTASYAYYAGSSSYALTASYALNGGGGGSTQVYYESGNSPTVTPANVNQGAMWYQDSNGTGYPVLYYWSVSGQQWVSMLN